MRNKIIPYNPKRRSFARKLRLESTLSEILLWKKIKNKSLGVAFHRQVPIDNFIVDFYCHEIMLAIEVDGSSHDIPGRHLKDVKRQERLEKLGVHFIRFKDLEVKKQMEGVLRALEIKIGELK